MLFTYLLSRFMKTILRQLQWLSLGDKFHVSLGDFVGKRHTEKLLVCEAVLRLLLLSELA